MTRLGSFRTTRCASGTTRPGSLLWAAGPRVHPWPDPRAHHLPRQAGRPAERLVSKLRAVGFYNDLGGYTLGQVWQAPHRPRCDQGPLSGRHGRRQADSSPRRRPIRCPTSARRSHLEGQHQRHAPAPKSANHWDLRLIQLDIAVRDARAEQRHGLGFRHLRLRRQTARWGSLAEARAPGASCGATTRRSRAPKPIVRANPTPT